LFFFVWLWYFVFVFVVSVCLPLYQLPTIMSGVGVWLLKGLLPPFLFNIIIHNSLVCLQYTTLLRVCKNPPSQRMLVQLV
jgi:hypothetical protein